MNGSFAVAPNFQCKGSWADRLLVAEGDGWRAPLDSELAALTNEAADESACSRLFSVPMHMRSRFWAMLNEEAEAGSGDFVSFSVDLAEFLTFKEFSPPTGAVCELLIQDAAGTVATGDIWGLINFGEEPVVLAWPRLQLRLHPGEGLRTTTDAPDVVPPSSDDPNVLVAIRFDAA